MEEIPQKNNMDQSFESILRRDWPPETWQDVTVLIAVSGGADSVALLRGLRQLKTNGAGRLHVAHLNHGLRGAEADTDEVFVKNLCRSLELPFHAGHSDVSSLATDRGDGIEEAARAARYTFLEQTAQRLGARFVATAHTSDDQLETIVYRILRGTGIAGLRGIPRFRRLNDLTTLVRPLLSVTRSSVLEYLTDAGQDFRTDSSNRDLRYMRNRIRCHLLPLLARDYHSHVGTSILRLGELAQGVQNIIETQVISLRSLTVISETANHVIFRKPLLKKADPHLVRELLIHIWHEQNWPRQSMGFDQWNAIAQLVHAATTSCTTLTLPGSIQASNTKSTLELKKVFHD